MINTVIAIVILGIIVTIFLLQKAKEVSIVKGVIDVPDDMVEWSKEEIEIESDIDYFRSEAGLDVLSTPFHLKRLSQEIVGFWKENEYTGDDNLHDHFLGIAARYKKIGMFSDMAQIASYGYKNVFTAIENSKDHLMLITGDWTYMAVTKKDKHCCILFAK